MSTLEHSEHIAHAGHSDGGHGHGGHGPGDKFGLLVGITMATLGVLLAFCAAKVGGERTELVQTLVEEQKAHQEWLGNDIKHRVAFIDLLEKHSLTTPEMLKDMNKDDSMFLADTVDRYLVEADMAKKWEAAYAGEIEAHVYAQEHYETGQLFAEIGIVVASVALLLKRRAAWGVSLALGAVAIFFVVATYLKTTKDVSTAKKSIDEYGEEYANRRTADKTTAAEASIVDSVRAWGGKSPAQNISGGALKEEGK